MSAFFTPYEGKRPYLFISYSHRNSQEVLDTIALLHQQKVRLWYDEGIPAGNDWPKNIETHMRSSAMVLFFLSKTALASNNCLSEIETAVALKKPVLYFTLDDAQPEGRWAELMQSCLPLPTPADAKARADQVTRHRKLKGSFYRRWWETIPPGLFGLLLSVILFGAALAVFMMVKEGTTMLIPFLGKTVDFGIMYIPFVVFIEVAMSNAVNLTDGCSHQRTEVVTDGTMYLCDILCHSCQAA